MNALKADNTRLQQLVTTRSMDGSQASAVSRSSTDSLEKRLSLGEASNIGTEQQYNLGQIQNESCSFDKFSVVFGYLF